MEFDANGGVNDWQKPDRQGAPSFHCMYHKPGRRAKKLTGRLVLCFA